MLSSIFLQLLVATSLFSESFAFTAVIPKDETHRPQFHYSVPKNWLNDPNGLVYLDGEYHLYYQYTPDSPLPGPKSWAHAVSPDLIHWTDLPVAISPDADGDIWSGSAVVDFTNSSGFQTGVDPSIITIYTHNGQSQQQYVAYSNDRGRTFTVYEGNPVIPNPGKRDFRDPKVIRWNDDSWVLVLAAGDRVEFYGSTDLKNWELLSDFGAEPDQGLKGVWECPDLFPLTFGNETVWVLLVSNGGGGPNEGSNTQYFIGDFNGKVFSSSQRNPAWMEWGIDNYATMSFYNEPLGRRVTIGWMTNLMYANDLPTGDWRGQMTLPRVLELKLARGQIRLQSLPAPELQGLNRPGEYLELGNPLQILPDGVLNYTGDSWNNPLMYLDLSFDISGFGGSSSISICLMNSLGEEVCWGYDEGSERGIFLDRTRSGHTDFNPSFSRRLSAERDSIDETIRFQVYVDVNGLELFVDSGLTTMTSLFYPGEPFRTVQIRHHASGNQGSELVLKSAFLQGLNSM